MTYSNQWETDTELLWVIDSQAGIDAWMVCKNPVDVEP